MPSEDLIVSYLNAYIKKSAIGTKYFVELRTDGDIYHIYFLGIKIWDSGEDERDYDVDQFIVNNGRIDSPLEALEPYLTRQIDDMITDLQSHRFAPAISSGNPLILPETPDCPGQTIRNCLKAGTDCASCIRNPYHSQTDRYLPPEELEI